MAHEMRFGVNFWTLVQDMRAICTGAFWEEPGRGSLLSGRYAGVLLTSAALYLPTLYALQQYMSTRKAFSLRPLVFVWNLILSTLSIVGVALALADGPEFLKHVYYPESAYKRNTRAVVALFALTKPLEFGDTFLLVLKKKPVTFLHAYHHWSVVIFCWYAQYVNVDFAHHFCLTNLSIHGIMYLYFALSVPLSRSPVMRCVRPFITIAQILQMFMGVYISYAVYNNEGLDPAFYGVAVSAVLLYMSYLYLFFDFFADGYLPHIPKPAGFAMCTSFAFAALGVCAYLHAPTCRNEFLVSGISAFSSLFLMSTKSIALDIPVESSKVSPLITSSKKIK